ncbi:DotU family type IV/VI secretion system protein [Caballeronia ptereochthonis]|uniref:OmpA family protein n=1 Tax=Caballeronia ptereochthonis TaxID=1777144 RepID=A0A158B3Z3_9BURK|nr:DotU family type IV/VI secretion system protein [Caballeronia ptereochthonis]SAK64729.1 ompA family protein [Caballeronia ptereochthonis]
MKLSSSSSRHMALVDQTPGGAPILASGIRDLLRDTALFVAQLSTGGKAGDLDALRTRCSQMIDQFSEALERRGYTVDVREDAVTAQCALLDETALHRLPGHDKARWTAQPLQVEKFRQHDGGDRVFDRLGVRMREDSPQIDLLECYAAILGLGFAGRYVVGGEERRQTLIRELNALLVRLRPEDAPSFITEQSGRRFGDWLHRISPWAIAAAACVAALVTWLIWHVALDAQLASLIPNAVKP